MRDADRAWKARFRGSAEGRLQGIADSAAELLAAAERAGEDLNAALLVHVESVRAVIAEHADLDRGLDAIVATLRSTYEDLAATLRADAVEVPQLRPANHVRNAFHVVWGLIGAGLVLALVRWPAVLIVLAAIFAGSFWFLEFSRRRRPQLNERLMHAFRHVSHPHEAHQVNSSTWYATALLLLTLTGEPTIMCVGVLVLGFADPAAAIVGRRFGRIKLVHGRTLEGSATFALVAAATVLAVLTLAGGTLLPSYGLGTRVALAFAAGLAGALAELFSRRVDDNFSVPIAAAAAAWLVLGLLG